MHPRVMPLLVGLAVAASVRAGAGVASHALAGRRIVNGLEGQPAFVADSVALLTARREIVEATVLSAWQTGKRERDRNADETAEGSGIVGAALAKLARSEVKELIVFLREGLGSRDI